MSNRESSLWPEDPMDRQPIPVAKGQETMFASDDAPVVVSRDPVHRADFSLKEPACTCGWTGESWVVHYTSTRKA